MRRVFGWRLKLTLNWLDAARAAGDPAAYLTLARKSRAIFPKDGDVLLALMLALDQNKHHEEAADVAEELVALSSDAAVLVQAAWALVTVGRSAQANAALAKVFATGPHIPLVENEALFLRGAALGGLGRPHLAEKDLRGALAGDDQRPAFIHGLAAFLVACDRRDEAVELVTVAKGVVDAADRAEILEDLAKMGLA